MLQDLIINALESIGYTYFIFCYMYMNKRNKILCCSLIFVISMGILTLSGYLQDIDYISLFVINVLTFILCYKYSKHSPFEIIFLLFYVETLIVISDIVSLWISAMAYHMEISMILTTPYLLFMTSLLSKVLFCILCVFSSKFVKKRDYVSSQSMMILGIIIIASFFTLSYSFVFLLQDQFNQQTGFVFMIVLSIIVILNYVLYYVLKEENYHQMLKNIQLTEFENMKLFIEATKRTNEENKKLRHYLNNVVLILKKEKQNQDIVNLCNKLENVENNVPFIETKNSVIDNIFNTVMLMYKDKNIQWRLYFESHLSKIESLDLAILLDSLLKLIVENIHIGEEVVFKTKDKEKYYYISIVFPYKENFNTETYAFLLEQMIKKYSGDMDIYKKNGVIYCDVILKNDR